MTEESKPKLLELFDNAAAFRQFEEWFVQNYPGPDTIIHRPAWHAPKIWRAALYALGMNERPAHELHPREGDNRAVSTEGCRSTATVSGTPESYSCFDPRQDARTPAGDGAPSPVLHADETTSGT